MACNDIVEVKDLGTTIPITDPTTVHHVTVVDSQDDNIEVTHGSRASEFIDVEGLRHRGLSANDKYVGIVTPGPNQEFTQFLEDFLKLVRKIKNGNGTDSDRCILPSGIRLCNNRIIHISSSKKYRKGKEFEMTERDLGEGNCGDPIRVVKDNMNAIEHALKSYCLEKAVVIERGLEKFKENEIRCWLDQNDSGNVPQLYMFQVKNRKVLLHMEILENVMTLKYLILNCRQNILKQPSLLKPFSLHIFRLLLCVMRDFHKTGWTHNDLHGGNVVVRISPDGLPKVYILDFGKAKRSGDIQQDVEDVAALFQGMLMGFEEQTSRIKITKTKIIFSTKDRKEFSELITKCSFLVQKSDLPDYIRRVDSSLHGARKVFGHDDRTMFKKITTIISSEPGVSLSDNSIEESFPSLPSPPKSPSGSPVYPQKPPPVEDLTSSHPARDISLATKMDTENDSDEYSHTGNFEETEVPEIEMEAKTSDSVVCRGDESDNLESTLSKLKVYSTE